MIVLGIDPSKTTGVAIVDTTTPKTLHAWCIHVGLEDRKHRTELEQAEWVTACLDDKLETVGAPLLGSIDLAAIEVPQSRNTLMSYKRNDGTRCTRVTTNSYQWVLIGMLWHALSQLYDVVEVPPALGKAALGLTSKASKDSVVLMAQHLTSVKLKRPKYAQEAVADAIATALAADKTRDQLLAARAKGNQK